MLYGYFYRLWIYFFQVLPPIHITSSAVEDWANGNIIWLGGSFFLVGSDFFMVNGTRRGLFLGQFDSEFSGLGFDSLSNTISFILLEKVDNICCNYAKVPKTEKSILFTQSFSYFFHVKIAKKREKL